MNRALPVTCDQRSPTGIQSPPHLPTSQLPLAGRNSAPELLLPASTLSHRTSSQKSNFLFLSSLYLCCSLSHSTDPQVYLSQFSCFLPHCHSPSFPSSSGTGEHYLYLQPVTCLADPYPTQTFLLLCPALVHLSALPPLPLTPRFCILGFFPYSAWHIGSIVPPAGCQTSAPSSYCPSKSVLST